MDDMFKDFIGEICHVEVLDGDDTTSYIGRVDGISPNNQVRLSYAYWYGTERGLWNLWDKVEELCRDGYNDRLVTKFRNHTWSKMLIFEPVRITPVEWELVKDTLFNNESIARFF